MRPFTRAAPEDDDGEPESDQDDEEQPESDDREIQVSSKRKRDSC